MAARAVTTLTTMLTRAVPDVRIELVEIVRVGNRFYLRITPNHYKYWIRFKKKYPNSVKLAQEYGARTLRAACPEFKSKKDLIEWLASVLKLTQGECKLFLVSLCEVV